ncbi:hypothetical protein ACVJF1_008939 [Bradyrhizobium diazoefficiens]
MPSDCHGKPSKFVCRVFGGEVGVVVEEVAAEFAPAELAQELLDAGPERRILGRGEARGVPDLPRAELAEPQMRRQA